MILTDDDLRTEREPVKEPAKAWVNWWLSRVDWFEEPGLTLRTAGDVLPGCRVWPSKDAAETAASRALEEDELNFDELLCDYLGAYPEGERP